MQVKSKFIFCFPLYFDYYLCCFAFRWVFYFVYIPLFILYFYRQIAGFLLFCSQSKTFTLKLSHYILAFGMLVFAASCNSSSDNKSGSGADGSAKFAAEPEGATLIKRSDCTTCHKPDVKLVGPSFKDIAAKYPNTEENIAKLTEKVMSGGSGVWGDVPMAAHPSLSKDDARKIVTYIITPSGGK